MTGRKIGVTYAAEASHLLVTAQHGDETVVALVAVSDPGVTLLESGSSARITTHTVVLDGAAGRAPRGRAAGRLARPRGLPGLCAHRRRSGGGRP